MAGKRNAEKATLWQEILERQASSRLSVRRFCESEGISEPSFYGWRRKLGRSSRRTTRTKVDRAKSKDPGSQFIPLALVDAPAMMELVHPLGHRLRLHGDVKPSTLANVLDAIERSPNR